MRAQVVIQERRALFAEWMSRKSMRLAVLLGVLLTMSIAVNAMIISPMAAGHNRAGVYQSRDLALAGLLFSQRVVA